MLRRAQQGSVYKEGSPAMKKKEKKKQELTFKERLKKIGI